MLSSSDLLGIHFEMFEAGVGRGVEATWSREWLAISETENSSFFYVRELSAHIIGKHIIIPGSHKT